MSNYIISTYDTIIRCRNRCKSKPQETNKVSDSAVAAEAKVAVSANMEGLSGIKLKRGAPQNQKLSNRAGEELQNPKKIRSKIENQDL